MTTVSAPIAVMGQGMLGVDITIFMLVVGAQVVSAVMAGRHWLSDSPAFALLRVFRCVGWSILAARFGTVLFTTGDVLISVPSAIALMFLACGDIAIVLFKGKWVKA